MVQKTYVVFEEQANVGNAVFAHGEVFNAVNKALSSTNFVIYFNGQSIGQ